MLATGDRGELPSMAAGLPVDAIRSELTPDQKTLIVLSERKAGPVMMIGDGVNDAPALAAADLGVAIGAKGAAASAEAADVVLLVDQLDRVLTAIRIAKRSRFIALQSVYVDSACRSPGWSPPPWVSSRRCRAPLPGSHRRCRHPQCPESSHRLTPRAVEMQQPLARIGRRGRRPDASGWQSPSARHSDSLATALLKIQPACRGNQFIEIQILRRREAPKVQSHGRCRSRAD